MRSVRTPESCLNTKMYDRQKSNKCQRIAASITIVSVTHDIATMKLNSDVFRLWDSE